MSYPTSIASVIDMTAGLRADAEDINFITTAVRDIGTELGTGPKGTAADVTTRLARSHNGSGDLSLKPATTLTISSGVITVTQNYHRVDTQSSASSDDLETITAPAAEGYVLRLRANNASRTVVIKHGTGNISCPGGKDISLVGTGGIIDLLYDADISKWIVVGSAGPFAASDNVFTGYNVFNSGEGHKTTAVNTSLTLDNTYNVVEVDASGASRIITLPDAATVPNMRFTVIKNDSSANTVTLTIDGSQTINGATTLVLSAQWAKATVQSNGTHWLVIG